MKHFKKTSSSVDEYLEEMFRCELAGVEIKTKGIARSLCISMPSVSQMLWKLMEKGFVIHKARGEIKLTNKGRRLGAKIYRKHESVKNFFKVLGLGEKAASEQACRLEHELSDHALKRLDKFMDSIVKKGNAGD